VSSPQLSIIVPAFNEAGNLPLLTEEIRMAMGNAAWEVLLVDDGSTDETRETIARLCVEDTRFRGFLLARNSGKGGALSVGIHHSRGKMVVMIDADLQNDPKDIPLLLAALAGGADMALGWRQERADPAGKRWASRIFNALCMLAFGTRLHDANTGFKAARREALARVPLQDGLYRFLPHMLIRRGWRVVEIPVHHRPRKSGATKFSLLHRLKSIPDLLVALAAARMQSDDPVPAHTEIVHSSTRQKAASATIAL